MWELMMNKKVLTVGSTLFFTLILFGQTTPTPRPQGPSTAQAAPRSPQAAAQGTPPATSNSSATQQALVNQYCVTCHNDRTRKANLSLKTVNMTVAGDHPEIWEKVIRKLRAGMMPPAGVRRPPLDQYEGLRDWLESEIDRKAFGKTNPGSVVLHRLNRTEYANAIRDLVDIEIDPASYLPSDDAARGFDNVAGSLTISPTLLEAYATAATRIARMAVGYWKSPGSANYIAAADRLKTSTGSASPLWMVES
jgi:mono/diheme cytochrome c family protein